MLISTFEMRLFFWVFVRFYLFSTRKTFQFLILFAIQSDLPINISARNLFDKQSRPSSWPCILTKKSSYEAKKQDKGQTDIQPICQSEKSLLLFLRVESQNIRNVNKTVFIGLSENYTDGEYSKCTEEVYFYFLSDYLSKASLVFK